MSEKKLTIPDVMPAVADYLRKNPVGGSLHIYLEDGNCERSSIEFCLKRAEEKGDTEGADLARMLLRMSDTQRRAIYKRKWRWFAKTN